MPPEDFWAFSLEYVLPHLGQAMLLTLELTLSSALTGMALGLILALLRLSPYTPLRWLVYGYVTLFRGTPLLLQILFVYFALPTLLDVRLEAYMSGFLALSLNAAAYLAEIFRSGIQSIDRGQFEAAKALGMSVYQSYRQVILPQALQRVIPPVVNELASLTKDSSLVSVIALGELLYVSQRLAAKYLRAWEVFLWAGLGYLAVVVTLTLCADALERRLQARSR